MFGQRPNVRPRRHWLEHPITIGLTNGLALAYDCQSEYARAEAAVHIGVGVRQTGPGAKSILNTSYY